MKKFLYIAGSVAVVSIVLGAGVAAYTVMKYSAELPELTAMRDYKPSLITTIYDKNDQKVAEYYVEKRILRRLYEIPSKMKLAALAIEDDNFYNHHGIDLWGIARAAMVNIRSGSVIQGGSTITQQVAKILFLTSERTFDRKIKEGLLSLRIERSFTKDEILEIYLNQIYFGHGAYGVEAASRLYFDKHVEELTLAEMALLAGLPKAPSKSSPFVNPGTALNRKNIVIRRMLELGYISEPQAELAISESLALAVRKKPLNHAPFFAEHVRRYLEKHYGSTSIYREGLKVYTTLDLELQKTAQAAIKEGLVDADHRLGYRGPVGWADPEQEVIDPEANNPELSEIPETEFYTTGSIYKATVQSVTPEMITVDMGSHSGSIEQAGFSWAHPVNPKIDGRTFKPVEDATTVVKPGDVVEVKVLDSHPETGLLLELYQTPALQGALLSVEYGSGAIRSMVGGYDFETSKFNRTVQAYRQAGSAFKPIIYAAALDKGLTPATIVVDSPLIFEDEIGEFKNWKPVNFRQKFYGPTTLRSAVAHSRNIVTIKVLQKIGINYVLEFAARLGIKSKLDDNLSLALGASSVNLMELTSVYGVFANGGVRNEPYFIRKIEDRTGAIIEEHEENPLSVIPEDTAYLINSILHAVVKEGTGRKVRSLGAPAAGKTGTTNDFMDAWFIGYASDVVTGVWVGKDREETIGKNETGSRTAAPIWLKYMKEAVSGGSLKPIIPPKNVVFVRIDRKTGKLSAPDNKDSVFEAFKEGTQPSEWAEPPKPKPEPKPVQTIQPDRVIESGTSMETETALPADPAPGTEQPPETQQDTTPEATLPSEG